MNLRKSFDSTAKNNGNIGRLLIIWHDFQKPLWETRDKNFTYIVLYIEIERR